MEPKEHKFNRRQFLRTAGKAGLASILLPACSRHNIKLPAPAQYRGHHHVCFASEAIQLDPNLLPAIHAAGVTDVWLTGFFYGHWPYPIENIHQAINTIEKFGMGAHIVNIPLGHPGDSLGSRDGKMPLTPPEHWSIAVRTDGTTYAGTSLHSPATEENQAALRQLQAIGIKNVFLDDDFRLARFAGIIGGCFCDRHRRKFLDLHGYNMSKWNELLGDINDRNLSPILENWVEFTCDELTDSFRAQQTAAPSIRLGIMVMCLGSEKAGIRLTDYANLPLRVGEGAFNDHDFAPVKNKTTELFSALFHRRFVKPENAFSETTAYPVNNLSAANIAAKLAVPLLADVRHTMFMSGVTPYPIDRWEIIAPAIRNQKFLREKIAGHQPRGPFKHYWGQHSRYVGDDNPYSLFLAIGIPFEVTEIPADNGWTFLSDFDARAAQEGFFKSNGTAFVYRPQAGAQLPAGQTVAESLESLFEFRRRLIPQLKGIPYVEEEVPAVCAWYPSVQTVLLWNLTEEKQNLTVNFNGRRPVYINSLEVAAVSLV